MALSGAEIAGEHHLGGAGGQFASGVGRAGLDDDRMALRTARDVQSAMDTEVRAFMVGDVHACRIEEQAAFAIAHEGVVVPGVP